MTWENICRCVHIFMLCIYKYFYTLSTRRKLYLNNSNKHSYHVVREFSYPSLFNGPWMQSAKVSKGWGWKHKYQDWPWSPSLRYKKEYMSKKKHYSSHCETIKFNRITLQERKKEQFSQWIVNSYYTILVDILCFMLR